MTLLIATVILVVVGGVIAFLGDKIGSTVGKKRLTVFKLRPRDTARVFTISSGSLIALLSFFTFYGLNRNFQIALQRGVELIHRNRTLTKANQALSLSLSQSQKQISAAQVQRLAEQAQLGAVNGQLKAAQTRITTVNSKLAQLQARLTTDEAHVNVLQAHALELTVENAKASQRLQQEYAQLKDRSEGTLVYRSEQEVGRCVIRSGQPVAAIRAEVLSFLAQLDAQAKSSGAAGAQIAMVGYSSPVIGQSENVDALSQSIHDAHDDRVAVIAKALGNAYSGGQVIVILRPYDDHLVFPAGAQLAKLTVPAVDSGNLPRLLSDLQSLLETARSRAIRSGVIPVTNPQIKQSEIGAVPFADLYQVADQIRASNGPSVVIVTAQKDTYSSDPLTLRFTVNGNDVHPG